MCASPWGAPLITLVNPFLKVAVWRTEWPAAELRRRGYPVAAFVKGTPDLSLKRGDVVVIHVTNQDTGLIGTLRHMREDYGVRVWIQFDDDYFSLGNLQSRGGPPMLWHMSGRWEHTRTYPSNWYAILMADMAQACREAEGVIASTSACLDAYRRFIGGQAVVIRNWLPRWITEHPVRREDPPVIGWMGTMEAHEKDVKWIGPDVQRFRRFGVVGDWKGWERFTGRPVDFRRPITLPPKLYSYIGRLSVGIAPVVPHAFNASKSWIKPLEYGALGIPCVATDHVPYRELQDDGYPLILVGDGATMVDTANMLLDAADADRDYWRSHVRERYTLESRGGDEWAAWADSVLGARV